MKDYELLYKYESMANDGNITIRLPKELKEEFLKKIGSNRAMGKFIREVMIEKLSNKPKEVVAIEEKAQEPPQ
jgi:hypothetical protein